MHTKNIKHIEKERKEEGEKSADRNLFLMYT